MKIKIQMSRALKYLIHARKFSIKTPYQKNTLRRFLPIEEKMKFVKTSANWIRGKPIIDTCFILNYGYEGPLPWPQV